MAYEDIATQQSAIDVVANETTNKANTKTRIANRFRAIVDSFLHLQNLTGVLGTSQTQVMHQKGVNDAFIALKDGVPVGGDTLNKLYNLITSLGEFAGNHNAASGLPATGTGVAGAVDKGDYWYITTPGSIAGLGDLAVGDVLFARIAGANEAAEFFYLPFATLVGNASETGKGIVEEVTDAEAQNPAHSGTGATGARLFLSNPKLWNWWTYIKTQAATIAGLWNFTTSPTVPTATAGDSTTKAASTAFATTADNLKLNKSANTEFESLADSSDDYGVAFLSRLGEVFKSTSVRWNESLKQLRVIGTQAIWSAVAGVTDGNMGIKILQGVIEGFKIFDDGGNYLSVGVESGVRNMRFFTPVKMRGGASNNETEFKNVAVDISSTQVLKTISIPNDSILTVDIMNISVMNSDENYLIGFSQMSFKNDAGSVTNISRDDLRYGRVYSSIKGAPGYVVNTDTRFDASISGTDVSINLVNTEAKLVMVNCEIKHTITLKPV